MNISWRSLWLFSLVLRTVDSIRCNLSTFSYRLLTAANVLRLVAVFSIGLGTAVCLSAEEAGKPETPAKNILMIAIDDLGNVLGRTRPAGLQTPHLDRLAKRGVFFERAYCQIPLCNPSRASVLTGLRPDITTVFDLDRHFRQQLPEVVTLPQFFRQHGWYAQRIGKIYHYDVPKGIGTDGLDDAPSWDRVSNPRGRDVTEESQIVNPTPQRPISAAMSWLAAEGSDAEQTDGMIATAAAEFLAHPPAQPFFLAVGFFRPHTPYVAPRKYFELYPLDNIVLPEVSEDDRQDIPRAAIPHNIPIANYGLEPPVLRQSLQAYYAATSFVDAQIGRVLEALEQADLHRNTLIVLWSDHGYHLGEHGLWQKRTLFDESSRTPLILVDPTAACSDQSDSALPTASQQVVELIDIYPTLVDLAGFAVPPHLSGRSLRPYLTPGEQVAPRPAFTQILRPGEPQPIMGRAITDSRWRYIEWDEGRLGRELYDHLQDPQEQHNVASDPTHQQVIEQLRASFSKKAQGTAPPSPFNRARL